MYDSNSVWLFYWMFRVDFGKTQESVGVFPTSEVFTKSDEQCLIPMWFLIPVKNGIPISCMIIPKQSQLYTIG